MNCPTCNEPMRCKYCGKKPRSKRTERNFERYSPFCTYACQQYHDLAQAQAHLQELSEATQ